MSTFETPHPISVSVEIDMGDIQIVAGDRTDCVVDVRPSDPARPADVAAAEQTQVEFTNERLLVRAPKGWRQWTPWSRRESIDVRIELPAGSRLEGRAGVATVRSSGRLGGCRFRTGFGDIRLDHAGPVEIRTGAGDITVDRLIGRSNVVVGSGVVSIRSVEGAAVVKNSNGDTWIGEAADDVQVNAANGRISIDLAHAGVSAKTAMGDVCLGEVTRGAVLAETSLGAVEVGIRDGVAAWLDLNTRFGNVQNDLDPSERPVPGEGTVEVRVRTSAGNITIHRSSSSTVREGHAEAPH
jgi:hypothetical protein